MGKHVEKVIERIADAVAGYRAADKRSVIWGRMRQQVEAGLRVVRGD